MVASQPGPPPLPIGRLAPSPTGLLHLGHARTFLLAWWHLRSRGGQVRMRVEDLDGDRSRPELIDAAARDLEWLGLDWDGPAELQSDGGERILEAVRELEGRGLAYACTCSRADVRAASAPHAGETELRYPGTCRDRYPSRAAADRPAGLRLRVPSGPVSFRDGFCGPQAFDVQRQVGDFLIARRDGSPAYQLAVVIDDARQGITEVLRGDDLLPSTARQILLQDALGLPPPRWFHAPLVLDADGRRLAKRAGDLSLAELRRAGADPRAIVAWAARTSGQEVSGRPTAAELVPAFRLDRLPPTPVVLAQAELTRLLP